MHVITTIIIVHTNKDSEYDRYEWFLKLLREKKYRKTMTAATTGAAAKTGTSTLYNDCNEILSIVILSLSNKLKLIR